VQRFTLHYSISSWLICTPILSFVGTSTALAFFEAGYKVRGTVRSAAKAEEWIALFTKYKPQFESAIVPDIAAPGAFDEAVKGVDYIAHSKTLHTLLNASIAQFIVQLPRHITLRSRYNQRWVEARVISHRSSRITKRTCSFLQFMERLISLVRLRKNRRSSILSLHRPLRLSSISN
jgi:hypothetical protein